MLAQLGIGSAHPGGFTETLRQLERLPLPKGALILEVGCGTGRTACYLAKRGFQVTGTDIRPEMIDKAKRRAEDEGADVIWSVGDARRLPFADGSFHVVVGESVTLFCGPGEALAEYCRVLKPGGVLYDREIFAARPLSTDTEREFNAVYQVNAVPTESEWLKALQQAGFADAHMWEPSPFPKPDVMWQDQVDHPDLAQKLDSNAFANEALFEAVGRYDRFMADYQHQFGYGVLIGRKPV